MSNERTNEIWILGATGRVGRALSEKLGAAAVDELVLVGRSEQRLARVAATVTRPVQTKTLAGFDEILAATRAERPLLVVNLLGSYETTAPALIQACLPGGRYVDLANDIGSLSSTLGGHDAARDAGSTVITGAGFGVLATEALVARLCAGMPTADRVQIDALASFATEAGVVGEVFAAIFVQVITAGALAYRDGTLAPVPLSSNLRRHTLPDGSTIKSAALPTGELFAAHAVSGAPTIDFTSGLAPTAPVLRAMLPLMSRLVAIPAFRRMMLRRIAATTTKAAPRPRAHSWGHAVVDWADGTTREGWLRAGDAMDFTADVLAAVIAAAVSADAPCGAFTPAAAFGPDIALHAGATFVD